MEFENRWESLARVDELRLPPSTNEKKLKEMALKKPIETLEERERERENEWKIELGLDWVDPNQLDANQFRAQPLDYIFDYQVIKI